ncbi:MAG TPA: efflux RND transporter periplasmic adaptor subunit, partial [Desulfobulbus sp.]|nr:efflux RND transporter periplasmic adaptor subunit [Desulfobulbus sp.]
DAARAALQETRVRRSYATITAPISGVIASVSTQQGETVAAGLNAPTFVTIIDLNRIQVDAFVDETDIGKVKIGQKTIFTVDTYPNKEFSGRVSAIYPKAIIQDNVVNYDVVVEIDSSFKELLRPDMTASVTIYQAVRKGVLMLPRNAILRENGRKFVLVQAAKGQLRKKAVQTGASSGNTIEIVSGLTEGDTVVVENKSS